MYSLSQEAFIVGSLDNKNKNVSEITERLSGKRILGHFSRWTYKSFFNNDGYIIRQINFYNNKQRADFRYNYFFSDSALIIASFLYSDTTDCLHFNYYFDSLGKYNLFEIYSIRNLDFPFMIGNEFAYKNNLLLSYNINTINIKGEPSSIDTIKFQYDSLGRINRRSIISNIENVISTENFTFFYDVHGRLTDYIQESSDSVGIYLGGVVWSEERENKVHFRFSNFDKYDNWRKSYYVTEKGEIFRSKRKIMYNKK